MGVKRSSLRCIFAESFWIKSKWILEKLFHPSHYVSVELARKSLFLLVRSSTLKMPLCCQRYKIINIFLSPVPSESLNSYPSFGQNFGEGSADMPREVFDPLIHRSTTFVLNGAAKSCWRWMELTKTVVFAGILMPLMTASFSSLRRVPETGGYSRSDSFKTCISKKHKSSVSSYIVESRNKINYLPMAFHFC